MECKITLGNLSQFDNSKIHEFNNPPLKIYLFNNQTNNISHNCLISSVQDLQYYAACMLYLCAALHPKYSKCIYQKAHMKKQI